MARPNGIGFEVALSAQAVDEVASRLIELLSEAGYLPESSVPRRDFPRLVTAAEVARQLGLNRGWVYEHKNDLGAIPIGSGEKPRLLFDLELVHEHLEDMRQGGFGKPLEPAPKKKPKRSPRLPKSDLLPVGQGRKAKRK